MAKFLDKKDRVIDLKLTSYGKYLLSLGTFKPVYYAFYDDNILYDGAYANITESQNNIHTRIKKETPYLESLVLFEDVGSRLEQIPRVDETGFGIISVDTVPLGPQKPRFDNFRYDNAIGDARFDNKKANLVPSWKVVTLQSQISSSSQKERKTAVTELNIPQINIDLQYKKIIRHIMESPNETFAGTDPGNVTLRTAQFSDQRYIELVLDNPMIYIDEVNTEILNDNFDIEVFVVEDGGSLNTTGSLKRKFFKNRKEQIVDGMMISNTPEFNINNESYTEDAVEYYFSILKDQEVNQRVACKSSDMYNKQTYYINLNFDCDLPQQENFYNDIYGSEVVPEICLD
jgi:hypothetical protein